MYKRQEWHREGWRTFSAFQDRVLSRGTVSYTHLNGIDQQTCAHDQTDSHVSNVITMMQINLIIADNSCFDADYHPSEWVSHNINSKKATLCLSPVVNFLTRDKNFHQIAFMHSTEIMSRKKILREHTTENLQVNQLCGCTADSYIAVSYTHLYSTVWFLRKYALITSIAIQFVTDKYSSFV